MLVSSTNSLYTVCIVQITAPEYTKEPRYQTPVSDGIACSLKVPCSEELKLQKKHNLVTEVVKSTDQCPVPQDENIPKKLYLSMLKSISVSCAFQFLVSATCQLFGKVNLQYSIIIE